MIIELIDRGIDALIAILKWAALVVALLLFVQWPLRKWLQAYSREANDLGQWLFALFVAASVTSATRAHRHIAADGLARNYSDARSKSITMPPPPAFGLPGLPTSLSGKP